MSENGHRADAVVVKFGDSSQWYDIATLDDFVPAGSRKRLAVLNRYKEPPKNLSAEIVRYKFISKEELYSICDNGIGSELALYMGNLYKVRKPHKCAEDDIYLLGDQIVPKNAIDAIYAACFDVQYQKAWYRCGVIGGDIGHVSVIVDDPHKRIGCPSLNFHYMWGDSAELAHDQIEAVRLCISDPITKDFLE